MLILSLQLQNLCGDGDTPLILTLRFELQVPIIVHAVRIGGLSVAMSVEKNVHGVEGKPSNPSKPSKPLLALPSALLLQGAIYSTPLQGPLDT